MIRSLLILQPSFLDSQTVIMSFGSHSTCSSSCCEYQSDINTCIKFLFHHTHRLILKSGHDDETTTKVIETAMNVIASMKGDWMQV